MVTTKFGDTFKRFMNKLNIELSNIGSYAKHYNDSDEKVKAIFKTKLKERLEATQVTRQSIQADIKSGKSYRLPFLKPHYEAFAKAYSSQMIEQNRDVYENLAETQSRYGEYKLSKHQNKEIISSLKDSVKHGEEYIFDSLRTVLDTLTMKVKEEYPDVFEIPKLVEALTFDVIFIMIGKWEESTEKRMKQRSDVSVDSSKMLHIMKVKYSFFKSIC